MIQSIGQSGGQSGFQSGVQSGGQSVIQSLFQSKRILKMINSNRKGLQRSCLWNE